MNRMNRITTLVLGASLGCALLGATPASAEEKASSRWPATQAGQPAPKVKGVPAELARNLANFDDLDFRVYTGQRWQDFHKSHTKDVIVHWPDGHTTQGLEGTFTKPMAIGDGKFIEPTGGEFMKQIGLAR